MHTRRQNLIHLLLSTALVLAATTATAQVYINGQLYHGAALNQLAADYGAAIPPGNYWLLQNGNWGYIGNPNVQGNFFTDYRGNTRQGSGFWEDEVDDFFIRNGIPSPSPW